LKFKIKRNWLGWRKTKAANKEIIKELIKDFSYEKNSRPIGMLNVAKQQEQKEKENNNNDKKGLFV
jgi:hypothetical protein